MTPRLLILVGSLVITTLAILSQFLLGSTPQEAHMSISLQLIGIYLILLFIASQR